jgi:hypothetical protein
MNKLFRNKQIFDAAEAEAGETPLAFLPFTPSVCMYAPACGASRKSIQLPAKRSRQCRTGKLFFDAALSGCLSLSITIRNEKNWVCKLKL